MENEGKKDVKSAVVRSRIPQAQKRAAVAAVFAGEASCLELGLRLGVHQSTVRDWVNNAASLSVVPARVFVPAPLKRRLAIAVKGGFMSEQEAMAEAGVSTRGVVGKWIKALEVDIAPLEQTAQEAMEDKNGASAQESHILRAEIAQLRLQVLALETLVEVAGEELGQDLRKKFGSRR